MFSRLPFPLQQFYYRHYESITFPFWTAKIKLYQRIMTTDQLNDYLDRDLEKRERKDKKHKQEDDELMAFIEMTTPILKTLVLLKQQYVTNPTWANYLAFKTYHEENLADPLPKWLKPPA